MKAPRRSRKPVTPEAGASPCAQRNRPRNSLGSSCWPFVLQAPGTRSRERCRKPRTAAMRCHRRAMACSGSIQEPVRFRPAHNSGAGWACYAVPDERAAMDAEIGRLQADIDRLQADNERLKAELAEREPTVPGKIEEPLPKSDSLKKSEPKVAEGERKIEIPLPSDRDMDRMMSFLERAWRRLDRDGQPGAAGRQRQDLTGAGALRRVVHMRTQGPIRRGLLECRSVEVNILRNNERRGYGSLRSQGRRVERLIP